MLLKKKLSCACIEAKSSMILSKAVHRLSQGGGQRGHGPPKCLENMVILCFERRFPKQNSVIHLKSSILAQKKIFGPLKFLGWLRH